MSVHTVSDVLDWYLATEVRSYAPVALKERQRLWLLFRQAVGERPLAECRPVDLLGFIANQRGARSNWTRRRIKATICRPFNAADVGLVSRNPFRGVKIPAGRNGRDWTDEEYRSILRGSRPYFRRLVVFLRFSGARPGEARKMRWPHVRREVEAFVQDEHKTAHTGAEPRRIHFNDVLIKLVGWLWRNRAGSDYVFTNGSGQPWSIKALTKYLLSIRRRLHLAEDVKVHGGRHTFATQAVLNEVDIYTLSQLLGHKSVQTTERYLHLAHRRRHLVEAMNKAIGRRRARG